MASLRLQERKGRTSFRPARFPVRKDSALRRRFACCLHGSRPRKGYGNHDRQRCEARRRLPMQIQDDVGGKSSEVIDSMSDRRREATHDGISTVRFEASASTLFRIAELSIAILPPQRRRIHGSQRAEKERHAAEGSFRLSVAPDREGGPP